ncbi:hypothetical protein QTN25_004217 [Entamoeba marina]
MQSKRIHDNYKNIDFYSIVIFPKYFENPQYYANVISVNFKYKNIKSRYIIYTKENRIKHGNEIPDCFNLLANKCFNRCTKSASINY